MQDVSNWLTRLNADGVSLNIKQLLYYQKKTSLLNLVPRKTIQSKLAGSYLAKTKGRGMEFDEARHYQPGDDIRAIDWRVTARSGKTHTKLYREEKERPIFILADLSPSMHFGTQLFYKSVQAAHLAALIAWSATNRGDRIGGLVFNQHQHREFKPLTRKKAVLGLLHGLVEVHQPNDLEPGSFQFSDACARLRRLVHPGSLVFVLSDFQNLNEGAKQHLSRISRHSEVIAYSITDPFEHDLPKVTNSQTVEITDGFDQQTLVLGEKTVSQQYHRSHQRQFEQISRILQQSKTQLLNVSAASPIEQQLVGKRGDNA
ncbi:DUF58 domain-containing protein [Aliiglaciecola sp. 3_MG-2023]|uniref:DUF58 domain-containing protein n=1 Tax=Aliiglaciecola sp. 3_MG-2023 TaxID=3062644 RepID=UPI0026E17782|nr:DUF58 domain-containing protein [Aliiglaciecola sp. 3_MG-2023]MDO6691692.1 DUF58 domain-containing protein [Aliiglaciecola sp. 3_MG-2023]